MLVVYAKKVMLFAFVLFSSMMLFNQSCIGYSIGMSSGSLDFPNAVTDTILQKTILISTDSEAPVTVHIALEGIPEDWADVPEKAVLARGRPFRMRLNIRIPESAVPELYTGMIILTAEEGGRDEGAGHAAQG